MYYEEEFFRELDRRRDKEGRRELDCEVIEVEIDKPDCRDHQVGGEREDHKHCNCGHRESDERDDWRHHHRDEDVRGERDERRYCKCGHEIGGRGQEHHHHGHGNIGGMNEDRPYRCHKHRHL